MILLLFPGQSPSSDVRGWSVGVVDERPFEAVVATGTFKVFIANSLFVGVSNSPNPSRAFVQTNLNPSAKIAVVTYPSVRILPVTNPTVKVMDYGVPD